MYDSAVSAAADNAGDSKIEDKRERGCDSAAEWFPSTGNTSPPPPEAQRTLQERMWTEDREQCMKHCLLDMA